MTTQHLAEPRSRIWKIERTWWEGRHLTLRCQADLRSLDDAARAAGKVLLHDMRFDLDDARDAEQLALIARATRGSTALPGNADPQRWTGIQFEASAARPAALRIARVDEPGQYRLWIPPQTAKLYARVRKGAALGLCDPEESFRRAGREPRPPAAPGRAQRGGARTHQRRGRWGARTREGTRNAPPTPAPTPQGSASPRRRARRRRAGKWPRRQSQSYTQILRAIDLDFGYLTGPVNDHAHASPPDPAQDIP